jgi:hypothetical protein
MRRKQRTDAYGLPPLGMTRESVVAALGSESIRRQLEAAGELAPFYRRPTFVLYDYADVVKAFVRFRAGLTSIPLDTTNGIPTGLRRRSAVTEQDPASDGGAGGPT